MYGFEIGSTKNPLIDVSLKSPYFSARYNIVFML